MQNPKPDLTLEELNQVVERLRRDQQADKDRAVKRVQKQLDELTAEVRELQELLRQSLTEEVAYERE